MKLAALIPAALLLVGGPGLRTAVAQPVVIDVMPNTGDRLTKINVSCPPETHPYWASYVAQRSPWCGPSWLSNAVDLCSDTGQYPPGTLRFACPAWTPTAGDIQWGYGPGEDDHIGGDHFTLNPASTICLPGRVSLYVDDLPAGSWRGSSASPIKISRVSWAWDEQWTLPYDQFAVWMDGLAIVRPSYATGLGVLFGFTACTRCSYDYLSVWVTETRRLEWTTPNVNGFFAVNSPAGTAVSITGCSPMEPGTDPRGQPSRVLVG
ncbi:MAG: hypothetical protein ACKVZJ_09585, partial [Phycisphaerales bacterium]